MFQSEVSLHPQAHQLLGVLKAERAETESACSGDGSNPDSGRGGSDQGHNEAGELPPFLTDTT